MVLSATSNVLAQAIASYQQGTPFQLQLTPVLQFVLFAALSCPPNFAWQRFLEESFPQWHVPSGNGREKAKKTLHLGNTAAKVALDQTVGAAVNTVLFIGIMGGLKGADLESIIQLIQRVSETVAGCA